MTNNFEKCKSILDEIAENENIDKRVCSSNGHSLWFLGTCIVACINTDVLGFRCIRIEILGKYPYHSLDYVSVNSNNWG